MKAKCGHLSLSSLYERGPKAEGSKFILAAKKCRKCGALFPVGNLAFGKKGGG